MVKQWQMRTLPQTQPQTASWSLSQVCHILVFVPTIHTLIIRGNLQCCSEMPGWKELAAVEFLIDDEAEEKLQLRAGSMVLMRYKCPNNNRRKLMVARVEAVLEVGAQKASFT